MNDIPLPEALELAASSDIETMHNQDVLRNALVTALDLTDRLELQLTNIDLAFTTLPKTQKYKRKRAPAI